LVPDVDLHCQVGDVLPRVGLAGDEKLSALELRELLEEVDDCLECVVGGVVVVVLVLSVGIEGVSHSCGRFEEEEVGDVVPGVLVLRQIVALFVVDAVLEEVGSDLLDESCVVDGVPSREEQPGPPLSQRVRGSLLSLPLADSTKT
jgi:hypothetical protein